MTSPTGSAMRYSGAEWLGNIPADWKVSKIGTL